MIMPSRTYLGDIHLVTVPFVLVLEEQHGLVDVLMVRDAVLLEGRARLRPSVLIERDHHLLGLRL